MSVAFGSIEEEIADSSPGNVLMLRGHVREDDPRRDFGSGPAHCRLLEVLLTQLGKAQEPEHCFGKTREDSKPTTEDRRLNLQTSLWSAILPLSRIVRSTPCIAG